MTNDDAERLLDYLTAVSDKFRPMKESFEIGEDELSLIFEFDDRDVHGKDMLIYLLNNINGELSQFERRLKDASADLMFSDINIFRSKLILKFKRR